MKERDDSSFKRAFRRWTSPYNWAISSIMTLAIMANDYRLYQADLARYESGQSVKKPVFERDYYRARIARCVPFNGLERISE